jgi:hypothetical protein
MKNNLEAYLLYLTTLGLLLVTHPKLNSKTNKLLLNSQAIK